MKEDKEPNPLCPRSLQGWPGSLPHPGAPMHRCPGTEAHSPRLSFGHRSESHETPKALPREPRGQKETLKTCIESDSERALAYRPRFCPFLSLGTLTSPQGVQHLCLLLIRGSEGNQGGGGEGLDRGSVSGVTPRRFNSYLSKNQSWGGLPCR